MINEIVMSPYEQLFVDVKFAGGTHGFVSVYLHEVLQGWRCVLLAIGFSLLFLATVASKCLPSSIATRPLAVRAIASINFTLSFVGSEFRLLFVPFQSSMDTLFATRFPEPNPQPDLPNSGTITGFRLPDLRVYGIFLHVSADLCKFPVLSGSENIGNRKQANLVFRKIVVKTRWFSICVRMLKSSSVFSNVLKWVPISDVEGMASSLRCSHDSLPFIYLGLPVGKIMRFCDGCSVVIDRFRDKLSCWKAKTLSIGGRVTLIKSILGSLPVYYLSF
ncbi:hypothetical protein Tco_0951571 [Tanacetum coccineum]|uniref:RNA-directed DNA polymerase, eukaryota n=1 Tax=Tanacetum coccineum TaxID=301880 RepID=A0ABQ5DXB6_9ASTR